MTHALFAFRARILAARWPAAVLAIVLTLSLGAPAGAQQAGVIAGVVVGAANQPVTGATVRVDGTNTVGTTDASGRFRLTGVAGTQATIEVRRIGYRPDRRVVDVGNTDVRIALAEQSVVLDEVVVTGTAGGQSKRELGNAVSSIDAVKTKEIAPINSVQNLLAGRVPGVFVNSATGNVGAGARVRIRGASSISLTNEPLLYIDGVRVNSSPASGFSNQAFGSASISRMNDINPDDIESIEIIKGPAAATLYGTEASNGVIQIITKKGTLGATRWSFATRVGTNYLPDPEGRWPVNWFPVPRSGSPGVLDTLSIDIIDQENARGAPVYKHGVVREYDLSASGGSPLFTYFAGVGLEDTDGIEPTSSVERYSGRLNLSSTPSPKINFSLNMGYVNGKIRLPCEAGCGGRTLGTIWATPLNDTTLSNGSPNPRHGFNSGTPSMYDELVQYSQGLNRFTGGVQVNHQPAAWFRQRISAGTDRVSEADDFLALRTEDSLSKVIFGTGALGGRDVRDRQVNNYSLDYSASGTFDFPSALRSTTSFGAQYYRNSASFVSASGTVFPVVGLTALSATTVRTNPTGDLEEDATLGFYLQEQVGWNDRLFVTAAIRADDNSAFGQNFNRVYYPKFGVSWVVSEEPFWTFSALNALKLRAAYGESGKQPITYSAIPTYTTATGPGEVATITPQFLGNPDLGPERSKEIEVGFDLGALDDRIGVELTHYRKQTVDAILDRQLAPSVGKPNTQPFNAGSIRNWGTELMVRGTPVMRDNLDWDVMVGLAHNDSEVESLGTSQGVLDQRRVRACPGYVPGTSSPSSCKVDDFVVGGFAIKHQVGYPIGSYFEQNMLSAALLPNGQPDLANVICADGKGGRMPCAGADLIYGDRTVNGVTTNDDAPEVFLGRSLPRFEGSLSNTLTVWKKLRVYAMLDFKLDFYKLDGNMRSRCAIFERCRENYFPFNRGDGTPFDPKTIAGLRSNGNIIDYYINNSGYAKLREISFSYTLPAISTRFASFNRAVITLAGRNLATWTDYPGLEPEAFFLGGARGGNFGQFEQTTNPQLRQWLLGINLDW
jgi:TonB-dependent SusC/RagA subfamily outer membrane receptor